MEKNKNKQKGLSEQVHGEFETSAANDFDVVREETPKKLDENDKGTALNQLPNEDVVKNEQDAGNELPKMNADPDS
ncbi:MAG TPA: hypothetical protein VM187_18500 [Niastella sp.]|nr:hypothetical protein [Niastella sp.]